MKKSVLAHLRDRLLDERSKAARANEAFDRDVRTAQESSGELNHFPLHSADAGTETTTDELSLSIASHRTQLFNQIDDALTRLYKDPAHFGTCENCGVQIPFERLDVLPWATLCLPCEGRETRRRTPATGGAEKT